MTSLRGESADSLTPAVDLVFANPALLARFRPWFLASQRRATVAGIHGYVGRTALRNGHWDTARRSLVQCLRRDPWRPREVILLLAALARRLPGPLRRRIK
jgi:hypothetical protein